MTWSFAAAAVLSFLTLCVHLFLGGRDVARPVLAARELDPVAKYTSYYCWHLVSMVLAAMTAAYAWAAFVPHAREAAVLVTALAAGFAVWSAALAVWKRQRFTVLPQWILFAPIAILGVVGLVAE